MTNNNNGIWVGLNAWADSPIRELTEVDAEDAIYMAERPAEYRYISRELWEVYCQAEQVCSDCIRLMFPREN